MENEKSDEEALQWAALERLPTYSRLRKGLLAQVKDGGEDNKEFLLNLRDRIQRVGIEIPTIEVRFEHLCVEAQGILNGLKILPRSKKPLQILHDASGVIKPGRMTLLLGPPSSGKTTLLLALAGRLKKDLKVTGSVTYNGHSMEDFVPQRFSAYISQYDLHIPEMTVRETLAFSRRCQGVGINFDMLVELLRKEKAANITPNFDIDIYMKEAALADQETNIVIDYILKILGLDICADTLVGNQMIRGISGGEKKRLTTDGHIIYQGPTENVLEFFESMGFKCPERKGVADYLQEVTSRRDQEQYWMHKNEPYVFTSAKAFAESFRTFHVGKRLDEELCVPFEESISHHGLLTSKEFGVNKKELFKAYGVYGIRRADDSLKKWLRWSKWLSPLMYAQKAVAVNEFLGNSWRNLNKELMLAAPGKPQTVIEEKGQDKLQATELHTKEGKEIAASRKRDVNTKSHGVIGDRLELLKGISGAFRPGILTALMGVSGAGKTTLMDVLSGRKTSGHIQGTIKISGFPKKQETFARISGYVEQTDIHSPYLTVYESLLFSAWLRLPSQVDPQTREMFIWEVMELVELTSLSKAMVGLPGVNGLSIEQRKRLTIALELVANPSIIFMDEPTSGLDARAAAIVMRTVKNTVNTGRTVVCTIHQPSIDIFDAFDELLLLKRGGEEIYFGPLGSHAQFLIKYFEEIDGVSKIKNGQNPATWMMGISSAAQEARLSVSFAKIYKQSELYRKSKQDLYNAMGCIYVAVHFLGIRNSASVQPVVAVERTVFYREKAAGMYSALAYAFSQRIPIWWRWYYWACPVAWSLYGLLVSQFGDIEDELENGETVKEFLKSYFGFRHEFLGVVAVIIVVFPALFSFVYAYAIKTLNFQKR
ncbi:hypothetical protein V2J09_007983 [Rumex salicifolius]